nr:MAG: hypothetical protein [Bacteriophage sp.]
MTENQAMLVVAEQTAKELGYIEVSKNAHNALRDRFWGNRAVAAMAGKPVVITTCKYILPIFEGEKDENKRRPKIEIDMFWGRPRLGIDLLDGTFCCLTYKDGICSEAQAFGEKGLAFALSIKERIDYLINQ